MDYTYSLLHKVFNHYKEHQKDVSNIYLACCQHILEPQQNMFGLFIEFGFDPKKIILLSKAYSLNKNIAFELEQKGIQVLYPDFTGTSFDEEHKNNCKEVVKKIPGDAKTIILDDGAELIQAFADAQRDILFGVEQTSSGFRKLEHNQLNFSVVNVARSATKLVQESPLVARLCFERINTYFEDKNINNPSILVVGLGPIGEAVLELLKQNDFKVDGFDIKHGHADLLSCIKNTNPDVIIGATGTSILSKEDIEGLAITKPLHLISVSSSDREFPVASFRKDKEVYADAQYKNITFVNNGFPITFKGNRNEMTPIEMEKTICLLMGSVLDGVKDEVLNKGLVNVPEELEKLINT